MKNEKTYLLTDGCLWEINKQTGNEHPHSIEVVDLETGAVRYIKSGSRIAFLEGEITDIRTQKCYNEGTKKMEEEMPSDEQDLQNGARSEKKSEGQSPVRIEAQSIQVSVLPSVASDTPKG